jgi:hypothetical protein
MTSATDTTPPRRRAPASPEAPTAPMSARPRGNGGRRGRGDGPWRAVRAAVTERLGYKAAAVFFSAVLWLVVSGEETGEQIIPVRLSTSVDSSLELVGPRPALRALVVGRARDLWKLADRPLVVRRVFTADTPDSVRVELRAGDIDVPSGPTSAVVRDVQPRVVTLYFAPTDAERARRAAAAAESATPAGGGAAAGTPSISRLHAGAARGADSASAAAARRGVAPARP